MKTHNTSGGILGIHLSHFYPHTHSRLKQDLPCCLKGIDMVVYEIFRALKLPVKLHSVLDDATQYMDDHELEDEDEYDGSESESDRSDNDSGNPVVNPEVSSPHMVGTGLHRFRVADDVNEEGFRQVLADNYPCIKRTDIHWVNKAMHKEMALAWLAHGNQATLYVEYAAAALLVDIPPAAKRELN